MRSKYQTTVSSGDIFALLSPSAESYIPATDRNPRAWQPQGRFWKVFPVDKEGGLLYFSFGLGPALCTADSDHRCARRGRKIHVIPDFWMWKWIPLGHGKGHLLAQASDSMLTPGMAGQWQAVLGPELAGLLIPRGTGEPRISTCLPSTCLFLAVFFFQSLNLHFTNLLMKTQLILFL